MTAYILRRLLLLVPTLLGISLACFILIQFVPGGPVEETISKIRAFSSMRGGSTREISPAEVENIKSYFGFDQPAYKRYFHWLGHLLKGDFGNSYTYHKPVLGVILSKMPISLFFGLTSFFLSYLISIPLGVAKALRNQSAFDTLSSTLIFAGYVMPGFALGVLLIIFFGGGSFLNWFPISGMVSDNFEFLGPWDKTLDFLHHMVLPLTCYMVGEFAVLTLLTKNSLLEELNKDYLRTALAKGVSFKSAAWRHALRNAFIPLATGMGEIFTVMFAGALLIEKIFDLDGMGLLFYNSIVGRDYNVVLGLIVLISLFTMLGRLFSDMLYAAADPRIRFD
ncbi:MAG: ABC transporter permease subunit [Methylacidiphilales bacterium]|nr:ABC transporter permease subunit [Candidatus Methylacidiphilales bacterium]